MLTLQYATLDIIQVPSMLYKLSLIVKTFTKF